MKPEEHLQRIRQRCVELLALAEKRTQGKWDIGDENNQHCEVSLPKDLTVSLDRYGRYTSGFVIERREMLANAHFIAACAGSAEAGWKATMASVDFYFEMLSQNFDARFMADAIIAAWPEHAL